MQKICLITAVRLFYKRYFQLQESKCSFVSTLIKFNKNNEDKGGSKIEILVRDKTFLIFLSHFSPSLLIGFIPYRILEIVI